MVAEAVQETADTTTLVFFTGNDRLDYKAGHFLTIDPHQFEGLERFIAFLEDLKGKKEPPRAYSMASSPAREVPGGDGQGGALRDGLDAVPAAALAAPREADPARDAPRRHRLHRALHPPRRHRVAHRPRRPRLRGLGQRPQLRDPEVRARPSSEAAAHVRLFEPDVGRRDLPSRPAGAGRGEPRPPEARPHPDPRARAAAPRPGRARRAREHGAAARGDPRPHDLPGVRLRAGDHDLGPQGGQGEPEWRRRRASWSRRSTA